MGKHKAHIQEERRVSRTVIHDREYLARVDAVSLAAQATNRSYLGMKDAAEFIETAEVIRQYIVDGTVPAVQPETTDVKS